MNLKNISRKEKEDLYIKKMTELQIRWKNPIDNDWDFSDWTDEQLDKGLSDTIGQLRFEKFQSGFGGSISMIVRIFVAIGIIGLLIFGIKQII